MNNENKQIQSALLENPWRNVYWFARMLINNDKYGGIIGKDNKLLAEISLGLRKVIEDCNHSDEIKMNVAKSVIKNMLDKHFAKRTTKTDRISLFYEDLVQRIKSTEDIAVLILTAESIMIPINKAIKWVPSNDREFAETTAKSYLDELKEAALATVINLWDDAGVEGCLNAERIAVVREFTNLQRNIAPLSLPEYEANMVMTAFVQEFERRLGQKRKGRAGGSLEDVTSFLFDYFNIKAEKCPEHFQADIEVDKWIKCKDKWLIGISCKRTLRERWKQVSSASKEILSNFKIREIWHLLTYDEDLSDDKLTLLGSQRHVFYLRDESRILAHALIDLCMGS